MPVLDNDNGRSHWDAEGQLDVPDDAGMGVPHNAPSQHDTALPGAIGVGMVKRGGGRTVPVPPEYSTQSR